jgi:hypothetical protein
MKEVTVNVPYRSFQWPREWLPKWVVCYSPFPNRKERRSQWKEIIRYK